LASREKTNKWRKIRLQKGIRPPPRTVKQKGARRGKELKGGMRLGSV